jgi:hypothetical protein
MKKETSVNLVASRATIFVFCFAFSSTLKMEATYLSGTAADFQQITLLYIADDNQLQILQIIGWISES